MKRFIAPLAVMLLAGIAPLARANLTITYSISGGPSGTCQATAPLAPGVWDVTCPFEAGPPLVLSLGATSNSPGTDALAEETSAVGNIRNLDTISHTIHIDVVAQEFAKPNAPPTLFFDSSVSVPAIVGAGTILNFQSCVDTSNGTLGSGTLDCLGSVPGGSPWVAAALTLSGPGSVASPTENILALGPGLYAIDEVFDITVAAGGSINFSARSSLTPVPEPMSIALLGGVVLLTSRLIRRKRSEVS